MLREILFLHRQESEKLSDEEMSVAAMEVLRRLFGEDIPQPVSVMATKWGSDTYSRGALPFMSPFLAMRTHMQCLIEILIYNLSQAFSADAHGNTSVLRRLNAL